MRDANIDNWKPEPHFVLFAHLASTPNGDACGLVVVKMGTGRMPCTGASDDGKGDVLLDAAGPIVGAHVQYWRALDGGQTLVTETLTNNAGRHTVWLEPGDYRYRYVHPTLPKDANPIGNKLVTVNVGRRISWEEPSDDESAPPRVMSKEIAGVWEDLVCDWHSEDGHAFDWNDVENACVKVAERAAATPGGGLQQLSLVIGGPFGIARPDIMNSFWSKGVPAVDIGWRDLQFATAYRNFNTIKNLGPCLKKHERANHQLQRVVFPTPKRVEARPGEPKYLADARVAAFYHAAQIAAFASPSLDGVGVLAAAMSPLGYAPGTPALPFATLGPMTGGDSLAESLGLPAGFDPRQPGLW